jgi:hypothetical protein
VHSARPLRLALAPSPGLATLIASVHGVAAACFLTVLTGWTAVAMAALILALGAAAAWDRALLRARRSPRALEFRPSGEAFCLLADGEFLPIAGRPGSTVTRYWVSLRLGSPWRRSLILVAGMLPGDAFRLLRLWALWGRLPGVASRQLAELL